MLLLRDPLPALAARDPWVEMGRCTAAGIEEGDEGGWPSVKQEEEELCLSDESYLCVHVCVTGIGKDGTRKTVHRL